ncbi:enoyl-ACP reductase FabV [Clostridium sp. AM58-1XD]|uniref:enoyl-ACP reductase FabV n=1 Tax=Clostridium sp. AM58-1XD TaxID=2292307 RepID=UPI000E485A45|nr:enoyl-ACP reductase FabV [Clostridium sp. AM58-1XD]RGZ01769.1 trans-2-enoyl-CoA reductase family protein [Clostridium sp. AM58-1XD]
MIVKPRVKDFICITAHPEGCREHVSRQIQYIKSKQGLKSNQRVLVIGASTGYGLSSRICAAFGGTCPTIGVCYERAASGNRTATAGWYNTAAFEEFAERDGIYAKTINGDAFSEQIKEDTISLIRRDLGQVDLVVYSLAAPRRTMPDGTVYTSVLKTLGKPFTSKSLDLSHNKLGETTVPAADEQEIEATDRVMGGDDWKDWIHALKSAGVLSERARTVAYSYIGPEMTYPIYAGGTIGHAKQHLYATALELHKEGIPSYVSVNKALVTQSSSAIPIVPLYIAVLYHVMKETGTHEDTIEQMYRLWNEYLYADEPVVDIPNRIRLDDLEMRTDIQEKVVDCWNRITDDNLEEYADISGYWEDFYHLFGFGFETIDYDQDTETDRKIKSLTE